MSGLVEEIQAAALDSGFRVSDLLRRVKLAAAKLGLEDVDAWVNRELQGYDATDDIPSYRHTKGQFMAHTPFHGVRPVVGQNEWIDKVCSGPILESVSRVEALAGDGTNEIIAQVDGPIETAMNEANNTRGTQYFVHISQTVFLDILQQVRNTVLDWAIGLEKAGILGEGISFSMEERKRAAEASSSIHIESFTGNFLQGDVTGNQNRLMAASTDQSVNSITTENVFEQLIQAVDRSIGNSNDREAIRGIVQELERTKGTADYAAWFHKIVGYAADYSTVLAPFIPALGQMLLQA